MSDSLPNSCRLCGEPAFRTYCLDDHFRPCKFCGEDFLVKLVSRPPEFCSVSCSARGRAGSLKLEKECAFCGETFVASTGSARYCGAEHKNICSHCGEGYGVKYPVKDKGYCSRACSAATPRYERECKRCGDTFLATGKQVYCAGPHFFTCGGCGGQFEDRIAKRTSRFCSLSCAGKSGSFKCVCGACGVEFVAAQPWAKFCGAQHTKPCEVCEALFVYDPTQPARSCSPKCAAGLIDYAARTRKNEEYFLKTYGVKNPSQIPAVKKKKEETMLKNFGVTNASYSPELKAKREATMLARFGVTNAMFSEEVKEKMREAYREKFGVDNPFKSEEVKEKIRATLRERYGVENSFLLPQALEGLAKVKNRRISKMNLEFKKQLEEALGETIKTEVPFGEHHHADLGLRDVLIDLNPTVSHNSTNSYIHLTGRCKTEDCETETHMPMPSRWHQERMLAAENERKILLQKFDWHDEEIFLSIVLAKLKKNSHRVGARQCELKIISQTEANKFLNANHLLGGTRGQTFCVGLFFKDELVHVHTYGPARLNRSFQWEAIRSASKKNWHIMGGFSRCDKYFFSTQQPTSVISYVDLAISQGETELSFPGWTPLTKKANSPSGTWVYSGTKKEQGNKPQFIKDRSAQRLSADKILGLTVGDKYPTHHPDGRTFTNQDVLKAENYLLVFDAGTRTYTWGTPTQKPQKQK